MFVIKAGPTIEVGDRVRHVPTGLVGRVILLQVPALPFSHIQAVVKTRTGAMLMTSANNFRFVMRCIK